MSNPQLSAFYENFKNDLRRILRTTSFLEMMMLPDRGTVRGFYTFRLSLLFNGAIVATPTMYMAGGNVQDGWSIGTAPDMLTCMTYGTEDFSAYRCDMCQTGGIINFWHCCECDYDLCPACGVDVSGDTHSHNNATHHMVQNVEFFDSNTYESQDVIEQLDVSINVRPIHSKL